MRVRVRVWGVRVRIVGGVDAAVGGEEDTWLLEHLVLDSMRDIGVGIEDICEWVGDVKIIGLAGGGAIALRSGLNKVR